MSNCLDIKYKSLRCMEKDFQYAVESILSQIEDCWACVHIIFFINATNDTQYFEFKKIVDKAICQRFPFNCPAHTIVAQASLEGTLQAEIQYYTDKEFYNILKYKKYGEHRYVTLETEDYKFLFTGALQSDNANESIGRQSKESYEKLQGMLHKEEMNISDIVRQWNYISKITNESEIYGQHYQQFNNVRSYYYNLDNWKDGYPAATGIGTASGTVILNADAFKSEKHRLISRPIDNRLQIAAHKYSDDVLSETNMGVSTPKFERARIISYQGQSMIYVSGTASIRGEKTISIGDIEGQYLCTMENIKEITEEAQPVFFRIYLKNGKCYNRVKELIDRDFPNVECIYVMADVCRENLLIEIEAIYKKSNNEKI